MDYVLLELVDLEGFETGVAHVVRTVGQEHVGFCLVLLRSLARRASGSQRFPGSLTDYRL